MASSDTARILAGISLFEGLDQGTLRAFAEKLSVVDRDPGDDVVREGDVSEELYVVIAGELEVVKTAPTGFEARVAMLGPRDWFGEMALLDPEPRSATVRAIAPSRLLKISKTDVDELLKAAAPAAYGCFMFNVARELSKRLRKADSIFANFVLSVSETYARRQ